MNCCNPDCPMPAARAARRATNLLRRGLTLAEVITCASIVVLLAAISYPVTLSAIRKSHDARCLSNMHQIWSAVALYRADYDPTSSGDMYQMGLPTYHAMSEIIDRVRLTCPEYNRGKPSGYLYQVNEPQIVVPVQWKDYTAQFGEAAMLETDVGHTPPANWDDPVAPKTGIGVRVSGEAVRRVRAGDPIHDRTWWH